MGGGGGGILSRGLVPWEESGDSRPPTSAPHCVRPGKEPAAWTQEGPSQEPMVSAAPGLNRQ